MEAIIETALAFSVLESAKLVFTPEFLDRLRSENEDRETTAIILAEAMGLLIALKRIEFKSESTPTAEAKGDTVKLS